MNDHKMTLKRPSGNEDEDEILKMQEQFLASKEAPAAKVQRVSRPQKHPVPENAKSKPNKQPPDKDSSSEIVDFTDYTTDLPVLLAIKEKNLGPKCVSAPSKTGKAFPRTFKLEDVQAVQGNKEGRRGPSLFAQQMRKKTEFRQFQPSRESPMDVNSSSDVVAEWTAGQERASDEPPADGRMNIADIRKENEAKIASMSIEEIKQYQGQLLTQLGPDVVNFIKRRSKKVESNLTKGQVTKQDMKSVPMSSESMSVDPQNEMKEKIDVRGNLELPIPAGEAKKWIHMDKIEYEKLAWTANLPPAKPLDPNTGHTARFDFQGFLLAHDEEIPVRQGLHHHGEEPEVAGYTIEEMFHLSRSSLASQRIIALQTLAKVLHNSNLGLFDKCLNSKLVPQLLDAGVIFLLRMAIDESQLDATGAAIYALHELLVSELDEACLNMTFTWQGGHLTPFLLCPKQSTKLSKEEKEEMPDTEIVKEDVILGLLRMDFLPRLRYVLEVMKPNDKSIVKHIFGILIRIARHSLQSSCQIMDCPRLMKTVFDNFIVIHWSESDDGAKTVYGYPCPQALKLVRCLASSGRNITNRLMHEFGLRELVNAYIAAQNCGSDMTQMRLEALRTWKVLLSYGLASETWLDLFPVLYEQYHHSQGLCLFGSGLAHDWHYVTLLLSALQSLLVIAASQSKDTLARVFCWKHVENVYGLVLNLAQKWLHELTLFGFKDLTIAINAPAAALNVLTSFLQLELTQPNVDTAKISDRICELWTKSIEPLLHSKGFSEMADNLSLSSSLVSSSSPGSNRNAPNLPFLGAVQFGGSDLSPSVREGSPLPLLVSVLAFTRLSNRMHCLKQESVDLVLKRFAAYARCVVTCGHLRRTWFAREETYLLHHLVQLVTAKTVKGKNEEEDVVALYHKVALLLPSLTGPAETHLTVQLFTDALFHPVFFSEEAKLSLQMMTLKTGSSEGLVSATGQSLEAREGLVLKDTFASLGAIRDLYLANVSFMPGIRKSRQILEQKFEEIQSLSVEYEAEVDRFSLDWPLSPLQVAYTRRNKVPSSDLGIVPVWTAAEIGACLHWLHYLMLARSDFVKHSMDAGHLFVHLCSVFLISDDLFLSPEVQSVLHCAFRRFFLLYKPDQLRLEKLQKPAPFLSFYEELVNHYESTSYGDPLFASVVLVPLQQKYSWLYKQIFLEQISQTLQRRLGHSAGHCLTLPLNQMLVPLEMYLYPLEEEMEMLQTYTKLLFSGSLVTCPLLKTMAVHHLHKFVFSTRPDERRKELLTHILHSCNVGQASAVILYKSVDPVNGVQVYSGLTVERRKFLENDGHCDIINKVEQVLGRAED